MDLPLVCLIKITGLDREGGGACARGWGEEGDCAKGGGGGGGCYSYFKSKNSITFFLFLRVFYEFMFKLANTCTVCSREETRTVSSRYLMTSHT